MCVRTFLRKKAVRREKKAKHCMVLENLTNHVVIAEATNAEAKMKYMQDAAEFVAAKQKRIYLYLYIRKEHPEWRDKMVLYL